MSIKLCTDLSDKEFHRLVGVGTVVTSGSLCGVMVSTLGWNARDVGSIPTLVTIFPIIFSTPMTVICRHHMCDYLKMPLLTDHMLWALKI